MQHHLPFRAVGIAVIVVAACCLFSLPLSALAQTFQVVQIWNDQNDLDGLRPSAAPVTVQGPGGEYSVLDSTPPGSA